MSVVTNTVSGLFYILSMTDNGVYKFTHNIKQSISMFLDNSKVFAHLGYFKNVLQNLPNVVTMKITQVQFSSGTNIFYL